jgi:hypothetical protein
MLGYAAGEFIADWWNAINGNVAGGRLEPSELGVSIKGFTPTHKCRIDLIPELMFFNNFAGCLNGNAGPSVIDFGDVGASIQTVHIMARDPILPSFPNYVRTHTRWARVDPGQTTVEKDEPEFTPYAPSPDAPPYPAIDPLSVPPVVPHFVPRPLPWKLIPHRQPNPFRDPLEQPQRGPAPNPRPVPRPLPRPRPERRNDPRRDPRRNPNVPRLPRPGPAIELFPRPGVRVRPSQPYRRPPPGDREKKFIANLNNNSGLGRLIGAITEGLDLLDAFHDALPDNCKQGTTPQGKALDLFNCYDQIDGETALKNILGNQAEDAVLGALGSAAADAYNNNPYNPGFATGPATGPAL